MSSSIFMMDWTRENEVSANEWELFVWHQMICSLIHDEVAAQDETLVMSTDRGGVVAECASRPTPAPNCENAATVLVVQRCTGRVRPFACP